VDPVTRSFLVRLIKQLAAFVAVALLLLLGSAGLVAAFLNILGAHR
jgi:hypothetical protein